MAQETVREFMADTTALPKRVVEIIENDRALSTAWNRYCGKKGRVCALKRRAVAADLAQAKECYVVVGADLRRIDR